MYDKKNNRFFNKKYSNIFHVERESITEITDLTIKTIHNGLEKYYADESKQGLKREIRLSRKISRTACILPTRIFGTRNFAIIKKTLLTLY